MVKIMYRDRVVPVWMLLVVATIFSCELFGISASQQVQKYTGIGVIVIAFLKARFIGLDFMELRNAPTVVRVVFESWILIICSVLASLYWWG